MNIQETVLFPGDTPTGIRYTLAKWMREVAQKLNRFDTQNDVVIDLASKGLVLKDTQSPAHYWRVTVSTLGVLVVTDLGTGKP